MYSTRGRPRVITDAQVAAILEWHRSHKPIGQFAQEQGLKKSTIHGVIKRGGQFKQPSPEKRELALSAQRRRIKKLREGGWL